jgi:hypothetical protein
MLKVETGRANIRAQAGDLGTVCIPFSHWRPKVGLGLGSEIQLR